MSGCVSHEMIEASLKQVQEDIKQHSEKLIGHGEKIASIEKQVELNKKSIEDLEVDNKAINRIATAVEVQTTELKHLVSKLNNHEGRIDLIEKKPAIYWQTVITALISAAVGYFIRLL